MTRTPYAPRSSLHALRITHYALRPTRYALRFTLHALRRHLPLFIILLVFTLLTLFNSMLLPLGEAADETDHYQYLRFVARTGHPPLTETERNQAGFKGGLAPLYYWLTAWPIALVGADTLPDIRRVDARPERHIPTDGLGINHVLHTQDEHWPWRGQPLAWRLVRLLSIPMGWVTIIATYALARRLLPQQKIVAIGAAAFVAFLPRFVISSAVINDDNLVFALTALLLLIQVIILQGNHKPLAFVIFGALFGLALITKYFALILIPEILFTLVVYYRAAGGRPQVTGDRLQVASNRSQVASRPTPHAPRFSLHAPVIAFFIALALTAGPWFIFITARFNRIDELGLIPGLAASLGEPQITEGLVGLLSGQAVRPPAATYSLPEWVSLLYRSFWFEYGWMQIFAPGWVYALFTIFLAAALLGLVSYFIRRNSPATSSKNLAPRSPLPAAPLPWLLGLHLALFVLVVLIRYILSATIDTGQGRHLYPALPVIALLISLGLYHLRFWIYDLRLKEPPDPNSSSPPIKHPYFLRNLPGETFLFLIPYFLLLTTAFLIPAFVLPYYHTLPITVTPAALPITFRQEISWADGLTLAGYDIAATTTAGDVLPVTLYWRAGQEADRDYLISLCLQDEQTRPVACWRGHFVNGRYPARAWEAGDTIIDTVFIPIPPCQRIDVSAYRLHLELWPLALDSAQPIPTGSPVLAHTFTEPLITIQPGDSDQDSTFWRGSDRLSRSTDVELNQTATQLGAANPMFENPEANTTWLPVTGFDSRLYLPCADTPTPQFQQHSFITDPTLLPGRYQPISSTTNLTLNVSPRLRALAPAQSNLTFADTLSPLSLQLPDQSSVDLSHSSSSLPTPYSLLPTDSLPLTIRWQTRRWMADPLIVSLKLLDKDYLVGGERVATLGDRYPNILWIPGEIVEETYPLQFKPDTPPGLYRLELSLIRQDQRLPDGFEYLPLSDGETNLGYNLYPLTVRVLDPAHDSPPSHPVSAQLGQAIQLIGYDLNPTSKFQLPNSNFELVLYWQSTAKIPTDYTVFTQLIGPDGQVWAQWDNPPQAGRYPTTAWAENDRVVDRYTLTLREGAPPGEYRLLVGMYDPNTGQRLPVTIDQQPQPDQAIELTRLMLNP